jgi:alkylated DNA nucleotide flippase Atl1
MSAMDFAHALVAAIPKGRWAAYRDVAEAAGNAKGAQAVGEWLRRNGDHVPGVYRVLRVDGHVSDGFRPAGPGVPANSERVREVLRAEGVHINDRGQAAARQRFTVADWKP